LAVYTILLVKEEGTTTEIEYEMSPSIEHLKEMVADIIKKFEDRIAEKQE